MNDLPELPFEKVLSYLSLKDRIKARAVSQSWYHRINNFKAKTLCFSERPSGFIFQKSRWVSGAFAQNFISSTRFDSFFGVFGKSMLSGLKHLRLCDLRLMAKSTALTQLNLFGQLEELAIIRLNDWQHGSGLKIQLKLHLPLLASIHLEEVDGIEQLTLDAPRLQKLKLKEARLRVELVHGESVKRLITDCFEQIAVKHLKNLEFLSCKNLPLSGLRLFDGLYCSMFDPTFLSSLQQLKEVHVADCREADTLWEQKQRYGRVGLKIYLWGLLQSEPPLLDFSEMILQTLWSGGEFVPHLVGKFSRLAEEIAFSSFLIYQTIERVPSGSEFDVLKRFADSYQLSVNHRVENVQRFLSLLRNFKNIVSLSFSSAQPRELFERLTEYCVVQRISFRNTTPNLECLLRLNHLTWLYLDYSVNAETVRRIIEHFEFLSTFKFKRRGKLVEIEIRPSSRFVILIEDQEKREMRDLDTAIQFIFENTQPNNWFQWILDLFD